MQKAPGFEFRQVHGKLSAAFGPAGDTAQVALSRDGFAIALRGGSRFEMRTTRAGRVGALKPLSSAAQASAKGQTIVLERPELEERALAGPLGLEQSFRIAARPAGSGPLAIEVEFQGLTPAAPTHATDRVALVDSNGIRRALYRDLLAVDATGRELPARMEPTAHSVVLVVDDARASYPIVVDPLVVTEQAKLAANDGAFHEGFGMSVSISGNTALVGAFSKNSTGAAFVFTFDGTSWTEQQVLTASDAVASDRFGQSVSVSGNTALVGANGKNNNQGAAYVFTFDGTTWSQQQELTVTGASGDQFGTSVSLVGDTALVGAPSKASAYVFTRNGTTWSEQQALSPADGSVSAVSLSETGTTALIGTKVGNGGKGSAHVFTFDGTSWSEQAKLIADAADSAVFDFFGASVSLSGNTALVGAPQRSNLAGAAYVYSFDGTSWSQQAELTHTGGATNQQLGFSVSVAGNTAVIGAPGDNEAFAYSFDGTSWSQQAEFTGSGVQSTDSFGYSVSLWEGTGLTALVGAYSTSSTNEAAYVFTLASPAALGAACSTGSDCSSGFCVDSVCCDTACGGGSTTDCQACSVAAGAAADGTCSAVADTTACEDGDACSVGDTCQRGICASGTAKSCDDGNPCTADLCDPVTGTCNDLVLADGTACGSGMICDTGSCASGCEIAGTFYASGTFEPGNPCKVCQPSSSTTDWTPNTGASCDDGDACTVGDVCDASGACTSTTSRSCDDSNPCTDDSCDPASGCVFTANTAPCDDGNACTQNDTCSSGSCVGQAVTCAEDSNPCTTAVCDPASGCGFINNSATCDDGNACTLNDRCQAGACVGSGAPDCDDGNVCTDDSCDPATGCAHADNTASCDDGDACTSGDTCSSGACVGTAVSYDAGDPCFGAACNPADGGVLLTARTGNACDDGRACTGPDICRSGVCTPDTNTCACNGDVDCAAPTQCQASVSCDLDGGTCVYVDQADGTGCDDGSLCTQTDTCQGGVCIGGNPVSCAASDACHLAGNCDPSSGLCSDPVAFDDAGCDDGRSCTGGDHCSAGTCVAGDASACACSQDSDCPAAPACQSVSCDVPSGTCVFANLADNTTCDDRSLCTTGERCVSGACTNPTSTVTCTALDQCHVAGTCDPATGLCSDPIATAGTACDDGRTCTTNDACQAGICVSDSSSCGCNGNADCTPLDECHQVGTCDLDLGTCSNPQKPDGTGCTGGTCQAGVCVPNGSSSGSSGSSSTSSSSSGSSGTSSSSGSSGTSSSSGSSGTSASSTSSGSSTGTSGASGTSGAPQGPETFHLSGSGCGCGTSGVDPFALFVLAGAGLAFARRRRGAR